MTLAAKMKTTVMNIEMLIYNKTSAKVTGRLLFYEFVQNRVNRF